MWRRIVRPAVGIGVALFLAAVWSAVRSEQPEAKVADAPRPPRATLDPADPDLTRLREKRLLFPVLGYDRRRLRDDFADPRGASRTNGALDLLAPRGTPVLAVDDGSVAKLYDSVGRGGLSIYHFDPDETYCYYYAHLDRYAAGLHDGTPLRKGEVVGYVGSTGNAPPQTPHLHFAIFKLGPEKQWGRGTPINAFSLWAPGIP